MEEFERGLNRGKISMANQILNVIESQKKEGATAEEIVKLISNFTKLIAEKY